MTRMTKEWLTEEEACQGDIERFSALFPGGCDINSTNFIEAWENGLEVEWFTGFLDPEERVNYNILRTKVEVLFGKHSLGLDTDCDTCRMQISILAGFVVRMLERLPEPPVETLL